MTDAVLRRRTKTNFRNGPPAPSFSEGPKGPETGLPETQNECRPRIRPALRRRRGGQKGNHNARKHGFYSAALGPDEASQCWNIARQEGLDMATAVLRVRLHSVLQQDPDNRRVLREATVLLSQLYSARYGLEPSDGNYLKKLVRALLEQNLEPASANKRPLQNESDVP